MFKDQAIIKELQNLVSQLQLSETAITFRGKTYGITSENALQCLTALLYAECYALKASYQEGLKEKQNYDPEEGYAFTESLSAHNNSRDRSEPGWQFGKDLGNGYFEMTRNGQSEIVPMTAVEGIRTAALQPETAFTVFFPKEDRLRQPTFYYVFSDRHMDLSQRLTRVYWNISSEGAQLLVDSITRKLNHYRIPFLFKCLNHPALYFRRDPAVLYIADTMMPMVEEILPEIYEGVQPCLEEDVPLFAYKYRKGIGIAENPVTQESFGMNRMAVLAAVLIANNALSEEDKLQAIAAAFSGKGIDPEAPYLNAGSKILLN